MYLANQNIKDRNLVRAREAAAFLSIGVSTFWKWVKEGKLPKGIRLGAGTTVWKVADLEEFIERRAAC